MCAIFYIYTGDNGWVRRGGGRGMQQPLPLVGERGWGIQHFYHQTFPHILFLPKTHPVLWKQGNYGNLISTKMLFFIISNLLYYFRTDLFSSTHHTYYLLVYSGSSLIVSMSQLLQECTHGERITLLLVSVYYVQHHSNAFEIGIHKI